MFSSKSEDADNVGTPPANLMPFNWRLLLAILLILLLLITLFCLITNSCQSTLNYRLHNGYEKLVVPLLARLGSNQSISSAAAAMNSGHDCVSSVSNGGSERRKSCRSGDADDKAKEWVWLPKRQECSASIGSRYSQRSTIGLSSTGRTHSHTSSSTNSSQSSNKHHLIQEEEEEDYRYYSSRKKSDAYNAVSYHGSEISVFLAPNNQQQRAKVSVNNQDESWSRRCSTGEKYHHSVKTLGAASSSGCFNMLEEAGDGALAPDFELMGTLRRQSRPIRQHSQGSSQGSSNGTLRKESLLIRHSSDSYGTANKSPPPPPCYDTMNKSDRVRYSGVSTRNASAENLHSAKSRKKHNVCPTAVSQSYGRKGSCGRPRETFA